MLLDIKSLKMWYVHSIMSAWIEWMQSITTLGPRQNCRHFANGAFKCIFPNENVWISINISLTFVPKVPIDHIAALAQIMAWRGPGDKPVF